MKFNVSDYEDFSKVDFYVCNLNRTVLGNGPIKCEDRKISFKFNDVDEISFKSYRKYNNELNESYEYLEPMRQIWIPKVGYYIIKDVSLEAENEENEYKDVSAYSAEVLIGQKYLRSFYINTGSEYDDSIDGVYFYNPNDTGHSLLHLALSKCPEWSIGEITDELCSLKYCFECDEQDVYSFLTQTISQKVDAIFVFDTINYIINIYRENDPRLAKAMDVHISFDNLCKKVKMSTDLDGIKTCLKLEGDEELTVRDVNYGQDSIYNFDYYLDEKWMSPHLVAAFNGWRKSLNEATAQRYKEASNAYADAVSKYNKIKYTDYADYNLPDSLRNNKDASEWTDLQCSTLIQDIKSAIGSADFFKSYDTDNLIAKYIIMGEWSKKDVAITNGNTVEKISYTLSATQIDNLCKNKNTIFNFDEYRKAISVAGKSDEIPMISATTIETQYKMCENQRIVCHTTEIQKSDLDILVSTGQDAKVNDFLEKYSLTYADDPTTDLTKEGISIKPTADKTQYPYWKIYLPNKERLAKLTTIKTNREQLLTDWEQIKKQNLNVMADLQKQLRLDTYLINYEREHSLPANSLWKELSSFIREDTFQSSDYVVTDIMTEDERTEQMVALLEKGNKELAKVCQPVYQFSAELMNLFVIDEFKPYTDKFEVGNWFYMTLRDDYIVKMRLLQMDINLDDYNDFNVTFGDLIKKKGSNVFDDITDALKLANSVATSVTFGEYDWNLAVTEENTPRMTVKKMLDEGLKLAAEALYDGTLSTTEISDRGIFVTNDAQTTEERKNDAIFIGNGRILFTDDNWDTVKTALGRIKFPYTQIVNGKYETRYKNTFGLLAQAVVAGYIAGSEIQGGVVRSVGYKPTTVSTNNGVTTWTTGSGSMFCLTDNENEIGYDGNYLINTPSLIIKRNNEAYFRGSMTIGGDKTNPATVLTVNDTNGKPIITIDKDGMNVSDDKIIKFTDNDKSLGDKLGQLGADITDITKSGGKIDDAKASAIITAKNGQLSTSVITIYYAITVTLDGSTTSTGISLDDFVKSSQYKAPSNPTRTDKKRITIANDTTTFNGWSFKCATPATSPSGKRTCTFYWQCVEYQKWVQNGTQIVIEYTYTEPIPYINGPATTEITKNTITTSYINALNITAQSATIANNVSAKYFEGKSIWVGQDAYKGDRAFNENNGMMTAHLRNKDMTAYEKMDIQNVCINANSKFLVTQEGAVYASDCELTGIIKAIDGKIGPWYINSNGINDNLEAFIEPNKVSVGNAGATFIRLQGFSDTNNPYAHNGYIWVSSNAADPTVWGCEGIEITYRSIIRHYADGTTKSVNFA